MSLLPFVLFMVLMYAFIMCTGGRTTDTDPFTEEVRRRRAADNPDARTSPATEADQHPGRISRAHRRDRPAPDMPVERSPSRAEDLATREYVCDGLIRLQIMLIQHRRDQPPRD